jgi:hypothetical protein
MWKAGVEIKQNEPVENDDWETDADYVNDVTEQQQRWGLQGSEGRQAGAIE